MGSVLALALPCSKCGAKSGDKCVRLDGVPGTTRNSHVNRTPVQPCGSYGGYQGHKKRGEQPCDKCREANRRYMAEYRRANPDRRDADLRALHLRNEAARLLIQRHEDEFRTLLADLHNHP